MKLIDRRKKDVLIKYFNHEHQTWHFNMSSKDGFGKLSPKFYARLAELATAKHNKFYY